jgi:hypothetical protein
MTENALNHKGGQPYTAEDATCPKRGVSALDIQRAADALLRPRRNGLTVAIREHLGKV